MAEIKVKSIPRDDEIGHLMTQYFENEFTEEFLLFGDEETSLPKYYVNYMESIKKFEIRESDVIICTFPKAGTTWMQEIVWSLANDLDYDGAKISILNRFPFLELCTLYDYDKLHKALDVTLSESAYASIEYIRRLKNPRFIKTHLPFSFLPDCIQDGSKTPKMIYVVRNPKDLCVSYYHHGEILQDWTANLDDFCKVFMTNKIMYGSLWKHVFGYWNRRNQSNLMIISYEQMKEDLPSVIKKVAEFLNKEYTDEQINTLCKHVSFDCMKNNTAINSEIFINMKRSKNLLLTEGRFCRSGIVGQYKEEIAPEMIEKLDVWIDENIGGTSFQKHFNYY